MEKLSDFRPQDENANSHSERGLKALSEAYQEVGYVAPMTAAANGEVIDGSARLERAFDQFPDEALVIRHDGSKPVIMIREDITDAQDPKAKRISYGANRIGEIDLVWDPAQVVADIDAGVDLSGLFFEDELKDLLADLVTDDPPDPIPPPIDKAAELQEKWGTSLGQIWELGRHRLAVGDCTDKAVVDSVLKGDIPLLMVTDPPYGVNYDPNWRNEAAEKGFLSYAERRTGKVVNDDRIDWSDAYLLFPGDVAYTWSPGGDPVILTGIAMQKAGFQIRNQIMWRKPHFPISRGHYTYQHEPCWYGVRKNKKAQWIGDHTASTVWEISLDQNVEGGHSTQKPLECMARPIANHKGDVYDPFLGSGTTLIACENLGRRCRGIEIDTGYAAVCLERFHIHSNILPRLIP